MKVKCELFIIHDQLIKKKKQLSFNTFASKLFRKRHYIATKIEIKYTFQQKFLEHGIIIPNKYV